MQVSHGVPIILGSRGDGGRLASAGPRQRPVIGMLDPGTTLRSTSAQVARSKSWPESDVERGSVKFILQLKKCNIHMVKIRLIYGQYIIRTWLPGAIAVKDGFSSKGADRPVRAILCIITTINIRPNIPALSYSLAARKARFTLFV